MIPSVPRPAGLRSTARLAVMVLLGTLHRSGRFIAERAGGLMVAAGACLLVGIIAGPVQAKQRTDREQLPLGPCRVDRIEEELLCGTLTVPENRDNPAGRQIELRVVVVPALEPEPGRAPLFDLAGGPGVAATGAAEFYARADLTQYTTTAAAADLNAVRQALGYDRIDLYGLSYGVRLALEFMRRYPEQVRSAVLQGAAPTSLAMPLHHAPDAERAAELLLEACETDAACRGAFPDLRREWDEVFSRLARVPARTRWSGASGKDVEIEIGRGTFATEIRSMMYTQAGARQVPLVIHEAAAGNFIPFLERVIPEEHHETGFIALGMYLSVTCTEDIPWIDAAEAERLALGTFLGDYRMAQQRRACEHWPRGRLPADFHDPVTSAIPALITSGYADPATPPRWGEEVARDLPNSRHVIIPHLTHLLDGLSNVAECLDPVLNEFFARGTAKGLDVECVTTMMPPPFILEGG